MRKAMLCPDCGRLVNVKAIDSRVTLACGHTRTAGLLPAKGVSLEDVILNTADALRLFPVELNGVRQ